MPMVPFNVQLAEAPTLLKPRLGFSIRTSHLSRPTRVGSVSDRLRRFWFTLGKLLAQDSARIWWQPDGFSFAEECQPSHTVAKQRRLVKTLKFFQNFDFIVENDLLGKFASMKALLSEVAKLQKPKAEVTEGDDEAKSDSGPSTEGETQSETVLP